MKLLRVRIESAQTCGGLLDGLDVRLRPDSTDYPAFMPLCLVGPNGAGKSQFLQVLTEVFQSVLHACVPTEERRECNPDVRFEVEYLIRSPSGKKPVHVRVARGASAGGAKGIVIQRRKDFDWEACDPTARETRDLLPTRIVGYTSGDNETLSLPFLVSRGAYADEVGRQALSTPSHRNPAADTRLMLVDYGTHLEVLAANLLLGSDAERKALLDDAGLRDLHSLRCIIQLNHSSAPGGSSRARRPGLRKGIQLTAELEGYIKHLQACATAWTYDEKSETYRLDFWINKATREAFRAFWTSSLDLYSALHKLAMLNDLAIPKPSRERMKQATRDRRFASRLPEPQDEEKVFRFERVQFRRTGSDQPVDYVSLSDGEHQLAQLLGTLCMVSFPGVLFLLDEPESHFNPQWRVKCVSKMLALPTHHGSRASGAERGRAAEQECLITTHAPFVPSDLPREQVFIFRKEAEGGKQTVTVRRPDIETYGTTFDTILEECFEVRPPISKVPLSEIATLKKSKSRSAVREGLDKLGPSVEKAFLADHLRQLESGGKQ